MAGNTRQQLPWHVVTHPQNSFTEGFDTDELAQADAEKRNAKLKELGIVNTTYIAVPNEN